jgi:hypothetical protein
MRLLLSIPLPPHISRTSGSSPLLSRHLFVALSISLHPLSKPPHFLRNPADTSQLAVSHGFPHTSNPRDSTSSNPSCSPPQISSQRSSSSRVPATVARIRLSRRVGHGTLSIQPSCLIDCWIGVQRNVGGGTLGGVCRRGMWPGFWQM